MSRLPDVIDSLRPTVVQICASAAGIPKGVFGSGYFVHTDGIVVTANHVIEKIEEIPDSEFLVALAAPNVETASGNVMRANFRAFNAQLVARSSLHDLAILKVMPNPFENPPAPLMILEGVEQRVQFAVAKTAAERPRDGDQIGISGYPFGSPVLISTAGIVATSWGLDDLQVEIAGTPQPLKFRDTYVGDISINGGNSGGPVYLVDSGEVIGTCVSFRKAWIPELLPQVLLSYNSGLCIIIPTKYTSELLASHLSL